MELQDLDKLVDEILDLAREHPIDDARIFVKDRIEKDIVGPAYSDGFNDANQWESKKPESLRRCSAIRRRNQNCTERKTTMTDVERRRETVT